MTTLPFEEVHKRETLKKVLDHELFAEALFDVRRQLGDEMLKTNDAGERERLHLELTLLNRIESKLTEYCNELLFLKKDEAA